MSTTRPRGPQPWNPHKKTLVIVGQVQEVIAQYADYLPLTIRLIFYRLHALFDYPKTDNAYQNLIGYIGRARRSGLISFDDIRDNGITEVRPLSFTGKPDFRQYLFDLASIYRRDRLEGQKAIVEVWCEAEGMVPQLVDVADPYGIAVCSCSGFDSLTFHHQVAERACTDRPLVVLHIGDYDFEGGHIYNAAREDVEAWVASMGGEVEFVRVAVTPEQIDEYDLPTAPPNPKNPGHRTCQAEALDPATLAEILTAAIENHLDLDAYRAELDIEETERDELVAEMRERMA